MFESRESRVSVGITFIFLIIAVIIQAPDGNIGLPPRTALAEFIIILGMLWFGMTMGVEIEKENQKKNKKK